MVQWEKVRKEDAATVGVQNSSNGFELRLRTVLGTGVRLAGACLVVFAAVLLAVAADEHAVTGQVAPALLRADLAQYLSAAAPLFVAALTLTWLAGRRKTSPVV